MNLYSMPSEDMLDMHSVNTLVEHFIRHIFFVILKVGILKKKKKEYLSTYRF